MVTGDAMVMSSTKQLGIAMSSTRYKRDIRDMGSKSAGLLALRPVTFRYRNDPTGTLQYGLAPEEVARQYPELVTYGADGKVMTVHYLTLTSMLLNELQKQASQNQRQAAEIEKLGAQMAEQQAMKERREAELSAQAGQLKRLSAQVADLRGLMERAAAKGNDRKLAAAFDW